MGRRTFTSDDYTNALRLFREHGDNFSQIAKRLPCDPRTAKQMYLYGLRSPWNAPEFATPIKRALDQEARAAAQPRPQDPRALKARNEESVEIGLAVITGRALHLWDRAYPYGERLAEHLRQMANVAALGPDDALRMLNGLTRFGKAVAALNELRIRSEKLRSGAPDAVVRVQMPSLSIAEVERQARATLIALEHWKEDHGGADVDDEIVAGAPTTPTSPKIDLGMTDDTIRRTFGPQLGGEAGGLRGEEWKPQSNGVPTRDAPLTERDNVVPLNKVPLH